MQESLQAVRKTYFSILIVRIYDLESGKKINEIKRENISGVTDRNIQAFDYRIIVYEASDTGNILRRFRYDEKL